MYVCIYVDYFATNKYTTIEVSIKFITVKLITYAIVKTQISTIWMVETVCTFLVFWYF